MVAADMLNDRVLPFYEEHDVPLLRVLTDRGTEYCGNRESHEYQLYLAVENIDHTRTRAKSPQTNGICERFHRTVYNWSAGRIRSSIRRRMKCPSYDLIRHFPIKLAPNGAGEECR
jgi:transposase InsO family protein